MSELIYPRLNFELLHTTDNSTRITLIRQILFCGQTLSPGHITLCDYVSLARYVADENYRRIWLAAILNTFNTKEREKQTRLLFPSRAKILSDLKSIAYEGMTYEEHDCSLLKLIYLAKPSPS